MNIITNKNIPVLDLDFDDIDEVYTTAEADCVGEFGDELPLCNEREQALYDFWVKLDKLADPRFEDKLTHAKPPVSFNSAFDELMDRWHEEMEP
jgi:hypothetical protein